MNASVKIETINPQQAELLLSNLWSGQRNLRESWVKRMAWEMKAGKFRLSSDAIVLVDGTLMNGQHRLRAVVDSKVSCQFLVLRTDDKEIYKIIDAGVKRTIGDCLQGTNTTMIPAVALWAMRHDRKLLTTGSTGSGSKRQPSRSEVIHFIERNRETLELAATSATKFYGKNKFLAPSISGAIIYLANREFGDDSGSRFIEAVYNGTANDMSRVVRDRLVNNRLAKVKFGTSFQFGLIVKAFHMWNEGECQPTIRITDNESFPRFGK